MKRRGRITKLRLTKLSAIAFGAAKLFAKRGLCPIAILSCCFCIAIATINNPVIAKSPDWIERSDQFAELLSEAISSEECEEKSALSDRLLELDPAFRACRQQNVQKAVQTLEQKLAQEKNAELRLDLEILLKSGQRSLRSYRLDEKYQLSYVHLSEAILNTFKSTLDDSQSSSSKQDAILAKLNQFAGFQSGKVPLVSSMEQAMRRQLQQKEIVFPSKKQLKKDLKSNARQVYAIQKFLRQQHISDYETAYAQLKTQLFDYETFIRSQVLPKAEHNFRLPRELYAFRLEEQGITAPIEKVIQQARTAFSQIQQEMSAIAPKIAQQKQLNVTDYRDVIKALQKERLSPIDTLKLYQRRAKELEAIIRREHLVTLPKHDFNIRLATKNEYQDFPVPLYDSDSGTFVLPVARNQKQARLYNDFTNPAMSWTLTVHEGRPGHDLQFATLRDRHLSQARTDFAANGTNIEGWATYAEAMMQPYMPIEGRFMSLQFELLRAARAFLEPELQLGKITIEEALQTITQDAGFSKFFAQQEVKRYTETMPGQAPTYFYGSQQFLQLRSHSEKILGKKFTPRKFHDFILSQGFLKPEVLQQLFLSQKP
jgi:uncharacterized protein (DUF885 family)